MKPREKLTPRELAIMQVVWKRGDATVRDVHEALSRECHSGGSFERWP